MNCNHRQHHCWSSRYVVGTARRSSVSIIVISMIAVAVFANVESIMADEPGAITQSPAQAGRPPLKVRPQGDAAIIRTVIDAVGLIRGLGPRETTATVNRLRWGGDGVMTEGRSTYKVTNYDYSLSLLQTAAREDIQREKSDGSSSRIVRVVVGRQAWNESAPGVYSGLALDQAMQRRLQFWRTPFGIAKALAIAPAGAVKLVDSTSGPAQLQLSIEGVATQVELDADYRPARVTQMVGKKKVEDQYSDYKDFSEYGLMFPGHFIETVNGKPYLDIHSHKADVGTYVVFPPPPGLPVTASSGR